jgi:hypothetical protein
MDTRVEREGDGVRFTYRVSHDADEYTAECLELDAMGVGSTVDAAVRSLRGLISERLRRPDAVAPPSRPDIDAFELEATTS